MKSQAISGNFQEADVEALVIAVFKDEKAADGVLKQLDDLTGGLAASLFESDEFKGEAGDMEHFRFAPNGNVKATRLLFVGVGERADYKPASVAVLSGTAARFLRKKGVKSFALMPRFEGDAAESAASAMQGVVTSQFELDKYKTKDKTDEKGKL